MNSTLKSGSVRVLVKSLNLRDIGFFEQGVLKAGTKLTIVGLNSQSIAVTPECNSGWTIWITRAEIKEFTTPYAYGEPVKIPGLGGYVEFK